MFREVLLPTDGSKTADRATDIALEMCKTHGARLHVLSVVAGFEHDLNIEYVKELIAAHREEAEEVLEAIRSRAEERGIETVATVDVQRKPFRVINEYCNDHDIDLVVMGTHGRSGLSRLFMGSTTERTLRLSSVPVLAVPPEESE